MGWFSGKKKVPINAVAESMARMVISAISPSKLQEVFADVLQGQVLSEAQRQEWLALNMFGMTKAVQDAIDSKMTSSKLLDTFHALVYQTVFPDDKQRADFESLLHDRYLSYFEILSGHPDSAFRLGAYFTDKFTGGKDIMLVYISSAIVLKSIEAMRNFLHDTSTKFELI